MDLLLIHVLAGASAPTCGVLLVAVLRIAARFIHGLIALRKATPEHVADVTRALYSHWRQR